jgi:hypothetical protein
VLALSPSSNKVFLHRCSVDGAQQRTSQDACHSHHVEGVEGEVMEPLDKQDESEDGGYPEAGGEEPRRLSQGVHQEDGTNTAIGPEKAMAL